MKNKKILSLFFIFLFLFSFFPYTAVKADSGNRIDSINIEVNILKDGDAIITETWTVYNDNEGTEWYKPMTNLNHMSLQDFSVKFNGEKGQAINNWDVDKSFEEKQNKYGIHKVANGFELCWGKTQRGKIAYEISYKYTDFVQKVKMKNPDKNKNIKNAFVAKLVNDSMDPAPNHVSVRIKSSGVDFNFNNSEIYAFGTDTGKIDFRNGHVVFKDDNFTGKKYLIIMLGTAHDLGAQYSSGKSYEDIKDMALKDSDYLAKKSKLNKIKDFLPFIIYPIVVILGTISGGRRAKGTSIRNKKEIDYELRPYNKESIVRNKTTSLIASATKEIPKMPNLTLREILSAQIIKWMNDRVLEINKAPYLGDNGYTIKITGVKPKLEEENELYYFILSKLKDKTNEEISTQEFSKTIASYSLAVAKILDKNFKEDYPEFVRNRDKNKKEKRGKYLTEKGKDLLIDINGAYQFLKDFTLIEEREIEELELWQDYMVEAVLFRMPPKVIEELKKAAPEIKIENKTNNNFEDYSESMDAGLYISNSVSRSFYNHYQSETSRTLGRGGHSSSGGGGGSSGGGSGGGSR